MLAYLSIAPVLCNSVKIYFFYVALLSQARNISEFEDARLCNNRLLRRNSSLSTENQELYRQVDLLTSENKSLQGILLESSDEFKSRSGRMPPINHAKDELMMELASVCEENKRLHIRIEKLKSAMRSKKRDFDTITGKLVSLKDELKEQSRGNDTLDIVLKFLEECIGQTDITHKTADSQNSQRSKRANNAQSSESFACTSVESNNIETPNCIQSLIELKEHELKLMASNTDSGIGDSLGQGKELQHIDSDRSFNHSVADETLDNSVKMSLNERKGFESMMESLQISNENLTREIYDLKNTNEQIKQEFTMKLTDMQMMNSELENKIKGYNLIEEQMAQIQEQNYLLEIENRKLQNFMEEANCRKGEIGEPEMKLETKESMKLQENCSIKTDNKMFKMLAMKSEERDAFAEECSKLRQEIEDMTMSIEDLAENITGISINGQGVAAAIDIITACCFDDGESESLSASELQEEVEVEQLRTYENTVEPKKIQHKSICDLKSECTLLRRSMSELEEKNNNLHELYVTLFEEKNELEQQNKTLQAAQSMGLSRMNSVECASDLETQLGRLSSIDSRSLNEKLSSLTSICVGLKANLQKTERDLSEWNEIGQLITEAIPGNQIQQDVSLPSTYYVKEELTRLVDEYNRLKCTEDIIMRQSLENEDVRDQLAALTLKNNDMSNELSKLALRERQFHDVKTRLSKSCNERNYLQRDIHMLTDRIAEYEENFMMYRDIIRECDELRLQHETVCKDKSKLEEILEEHVNVLELLQKENLMLQERNQELSELTNQENQQKIETENLKEEILRFKNLTIEQAEKQRALEEEVENLKRQIEKKEKEIVEAQEENSKVRARLSEIALEVEEMDRLKCENEVNESINVEQRDTISNLHIQKAELATEVDCLRSKLGSLDNIRQEHDELIQELEMYKRKLYDMESKYKQAADLVVDFDTRFDNTEEELAEANKLVETLSKENIHLVGECSSSAESIERLQELLKKSSKEKLLLEEDAIRLQEEVHALKTEVEPKQSRSIDKVSRVLARSKSDVTCYMSEYLEKNYHFGNRFNMKAKDMIGCEEIVEREAENARLQLENAQLKVKYDTLKEERGFKNLECANETAHRSIDNSKVVGSFQERLDALMQSNAKLTEEKVEMEKQVEEVVAENESLCAQVSEVRNQK